jgi:hypothetical protein
MTHRKKLEMRTIVNIKVYLGQVEVCAGSASDAYTLDGLRTLADRWVGINNWDRIELVDLDPRPQGHNNQDALQAEAV